MSSVKGNECIYPMASRLGDAIDIVEVVGYRDDSCSFAVNK